MRLPTNLGLKIYLILFTIFSISTLLALSSPEGVTYTYYNILLTLHKPAMAWYLLAVLNALLSCTVIIPLYRRAFNLPIIEPRLFKWIFYLRLGTMLLGNNYEIITIRAAFHGSSLLMGFITLGIWLIFLYPSFKEHYIYSFKSK